MRQNATETARVVTSPEAPMPEQMVQAATRLAVTSGLSHADALECFRVASDYLTPKQAEARATRAVDQERAKVVAWLEQGATTTHAARCIERGDHLA